MTELEQPKSSPEVSALGRKRKAFWTKQFYLWHWVSSALCLVAMLFFAFTGITLNHAGDISAKPRVTEQKLTLPPELMAAIGPAQGAEKKAPLPDELATWLNTALQQRVKGKSADWSEEEIYLSLPRPGGDAWVNIDRETGTVTYELSSRGTIAWLNDLHKGRHTGKAWSWFLDIFSGLCVVFCLTGLGLLVAHARRRPSTWPIVIAGLVIPALVILFLMH